MEKLRLFLFEDVLAGPAKWTGPILWQCFKRGAWCDATVGVALCWVINILANGADPTFHADTPFLCGVLFPTDALDRTAIYSLLDFLF